MNSNLQLLGLMKKAGLLAVGGDAAAAAARAGKARLVVIASDASTNARSRAAYISKISRTACVIVPFTKFEIGSVTGRGSPGTVAVLDAGFSARFARGLAMTDPDLYGETAESLEGRSRAAASKNNPNQRRTAK
ncbi:MAG: 50S ribosomal protein L7ae [Oscillospiraceae bacterium]|nr:50S ribosomal protein L7ae [Oscillospiraceae bacterium]